MSSSAPSASRSSGARRSALVTLVVMLVAGVVGGIVWWLVWTPPTYTVVDGQVGLDEINVAQSFTSDAWYLVVAGPLALLVGLVRRRTSRSSGLLDLGAALVGAVAAAYVMLGVGGLLGPDALEGERMRGLADGATVQGPLQLASAVADSGIGAYVYVVMLAWLIGVLAGWVAELVFPVLEPAHARELESDTISGDPAPSSSSSP